MGIREKLNQNPAITTGATAAIIVIAIIFIVMQLFSSRSSGVGSNETYYSSDDGKTWFADAATKSPPFMKDGKEVVRAWVFKNEKSGEKKVMFLEKYTPEAQKAMQTFQDQMAKALNNPATANKPPMPGPMFDMQQQQMIQMGKLTKRPGDAQWLSMKDGPAFMKISEVPPDWVPMIPGE